MNHQRLRKQIIFLALATLFLLGCANALFRSSVTSTPIPPTSTSTPIPPTATFTPVPPTPTPTPIPPTPSPTPVPPTPTSTLPPGPKAGPWLGSVPFGGWAFFEVTPNGEILNFSIEIPLGANRCTITLDKEIVIEPDGTFIIGAVDSEGTLEANSISGKFDSATSMTGAYSKTWLCGNQLSASTAEGTWSAEWKEP